MGKPRFELRIPAYAAAVVVLYLFVQSTGRVRSLPNPLRHSLEPQRLHPPFNKSILYLKPHKTGSESFKENLMAIAKHYGLSTNYKQDIRRRDIRKSGKQFDVLLTHSAWAPNLLNFLTQPSNYVSVVTIRHPVERLISHYFSALRFHREKHQEIENLSRGNKTERFLLWLDKYADSHQVRWLSDRNLSPNGSLHERIATVVDFYDHVVVVEQWRLSLCLFGLSERLPPELLSARKRNVGTTAAVPKYVQETEELKSNPLVYEAIVRKIGYDFVLYNELFKRYSRAVEVTGYQALSEYCDKVH